MRADSRESVPQTFSISGAISLPPESGSVSNRISASFPSRSREDDRERLARLAELAPGFDFEAAQALLERRRAEYRAEHKEQRRERPARPAGYAPELLESPPAPQASAEKALPSDTIKVWSAVILWAAHAGKHGGAARVWFLARSLDQNGSGWILRSDLWEFLRSLGVGERKRRRWLGDALSLGLLTETVIWGAPAYHMASLGRGAVALGAQELGRPSTVSAQALVNSGWRAYVWSAYIAALRERPISQETKAQLTGVKPRTQRNYQADLPGSSRSNYAETALTGSDKIIGLREHGRRSAFVGQAGRIFYRLPDIRFTPRFISQSLARGRSKKAQRIINRLFHEEQAEGYFVRLFHQTHRTAESAIKHIVKSDIPPWELPGELFELVYAGRRSNIWSPVAVQM